MSIEPSVDHYGNCRWIVGGMGAIYVDAIRQMDNSYAVFSVSSLGHERHEVETPGWLMRLLGDTLERRVLRTVDREVRRLTRHKERCEAKSTEALSVQESIKTRRMPL